MATGFSFGAKTTATPTFGTGSLTFGTPAALGAATSSTPSLFGTPAAPSAASFAPTGFGTAATTQSTGFSFGTASTSGGFGTGTPGSTATGLSFGTPATKAPTFGTPAATGLTFGTPAPSGITLGTPASTASFGVSTSAPTFGIGTTSTAPAFGLTSTVGSLGTSSAAPSFGVSIGTTSTGLGFGTTPGLSFGTATTAPTLGTSTATGFGLGAPATSTGFSLGGTATSTGFSLGGTTTSAGFSLGGTTTSAGFSLGGTATSSTGLGGFAASTQPQSVGLGGVAFTQSKTGTASSAQKELPPKEQVLPNEINQLVEQFKTIVQQEKNRSTEVSRCNIKEFRKVESDLDVLNHQFNQVENQLVNYRNIAEQLKYDTAKGLQNMEMAQRTQGTPPSLQYDNTAPMQFFLELAESFEKEMQQLKLKIDNTEKFIKKVNEPSVLTSQDLAQGLKKLHETFVALAGRMQSVHSQVEAQKEVFLNLRKQVVKDNLNPFEKADKNFEAMNVIMRNALKAAPPAFASGPTPFNSIAVGSNNVALQQQAQNTPFPAVTTSTLSFGVGNTAPAFGTAPSNTSLFKPTGFGSSSPFQLSQTSTNFQLQKPPTGTKRGKQ